MPTHLRVARIAPTAVLATTTFTTVAAAVLAASPAQAATGDPAAASIIASNSAAAPVRPARSQLIGVDADIPAGLTITGTQGKPVTLTTRGQRARTAIGRDGAPVVFTKLTPGRTYTVYVGGTKIGTARPVAIPTRAWGLTVSTTGTPGAVSLTWQHTGSIPHGRVAYVVTATPRGTDGLPLPGGHVVTVTVTGPAALLTGLDPHLLYTFTVAATNSAGHGEPSTAVMNRTLGDIFGTSDIATDPAPEPKTTPVAPVPTVVPAPAPAPAPAGPSTRTIYVCPTGFVDAGDACTDTKAYTFHTETVTLAYTFHNGVIGSHVVTHPPTHCDYLPNPNSPTGLDIYCTGGYDETVLDYGSVKDATPTGYTDNGTAWVKDVQVKDATPAGYADSGSAWVKTVGKVATTVPA
jgi:hypothetical protein